MESTMNVKYDPSPALVSFHRSPSHSEPRVRQPPKDSMLQRVRSIHCAQRPIMHLGHVSPSA